LISPVILFLIVLISSDENIMGQWKSGAWSRVFGWATVLIMSLVSFTTLFFLFF